MRVFCFGVLQLSIAAASHTQMHYNSGTASGIEGADNVQLKSYCGQKFKFRGFGVQSYKCMAVPQSHERFQWRPEKAQGLLHAYVNKDAVNAKASGSFSTLDGGSDIITDVILGACKLDSGHPMCSVSVDSWHGRQLKSVDYHPNLAWTLSGATMTSGPSLANAEFLQRVNTLGGLSDAKICKEEEDGLTMNVPFEADYIFGFCDGTGKFGIHYAVPLRHKLGGTQPVNPKGCKQNVFLRGDGIQEYICKKSEHGFEWALKGAKAFLHQYNHDGITINPETTGYHFFEFPADLYSKAQRPDWVLGNFCNLHSCTETNAVWQGNAHPLREEVNLKHETAIPLLLLKKTQASGSLAKQNRLQRLNTDGGAVPMNEAVNCANDEDAGKTLSVQYEADYVFAQCPEYIDVWQNKDDVKYYDPSELYRGLSAEEADCIHNLFKYRDSIHRIVKKTNSGMESWTLSSDPIVADLIRQHYYEMKQAVQAGRWFRRYSEDEHVLWAARGPHLNYIVSDAKPLADGLHVKQNGFTPCAVHAVQAHATMVSKFLSEDGWGIALQNHKVQHCPHLGAETYARDGDHSLIRTDTPRKF